jgi:hypothetical protein
MPTPLPVLAGVYYARIVGSMSTGQISNLFTFVKDGVPLGDASDITNAQQVSVALAARWPTIPALALADEYAGVAVETYPLGSPLIPKQISPLTAPGGNAGNVAPVSTAIVVRHDVIRRGRGSQSRSYLSPVTSAIFTADGTQINSSLVTSLSTAFQLFLADVVDDLAIASPGTWSYQQLSKHPTPRTFRIDSSEAEAFLSTQRRRARRP